MRRAPTPVRKIAAVVIVVVMCQRLVASAAGAAYASFGARGTSAARRGATSAASSSAAPPALLLALGGGGRSAPFVSAAPRSEARRRGRPLPPLFSAPALPGRASRGRGRASGALAQPGLARRAAWSSSSSSSSSSAPSSSLAARPSAAAAEASSPPPASAASPRGESESSSPPQAPDPFDLDTLRSKFLTTMRDRGFLHQCTGWRDLDDLLLEAEEERGGEGEGEGEGRPRRRRPVRAYLGFDATADSLHVGSLLQIMVLRWFQRCGHQPIVLLGGGTSKVGDPTGKDESRAMLGDDDIRRNIRGISAVFAKFLRLQGEAEEGVGGEGEKEGEGASATAAIVVNNDDWLSRLSYLDFLRDYGTHFTVNRMLSFESVKQRLAREAPLTFLEFNYMVLQAYDFLELSRRYGAVLQLGGSDQWGNMVAGVELGRKAGGGGAGARLHALTAPLITTSDGRKMGKTASGAVWLNPDRLGPYGYWQFWRNTADGDVVRFLKLFTELDLAEIQEMEGWTGSKINQAKVVLADRATELLHGPDVLPGIHETALQLFSGTGAGGGGGAAAASAASPSSTEGLARVRVTRGRLLEAEGGGVRVADLLVELGLAPSKKEARRLIAGGGARKSAAAGGSGEQLDARIDDELAALTLDDFASSPEVVLRAGKKRAGVVELSDE